jgi:thioesterase domain-containing protein
VRAALGQAWRAVIGGRLSGGQTLEQAGCDSLRFLQLVLVLERALDRPIPLDLLDIEMQADDVVTALLGPQPPQAVTDGRPVVFLMPGLDDDEQRLARFRVALQASVRFVLMTYPDWPEMMRPGWSYADLIEAVADQVARQASGAPLLLTGYSFGGEVAFSVAARLRALGHDVRWVGILDTDITRVPPPPKRGVVARLQRYSREMADDIRHEGLHKSAGLLLAKLGRQGVGLARMHRSLRWWRPLLPARTEFWFHRRIRSILRIKALWAWLDADIARRLDVPVTLFRSEIGLGPSPPDMGWAARCPNLSIAKIGGDHHTLFDPPHREALYERYAAVVSHLAAGS